MAGFGVKLWVIAQDITQLQRLYAKSWETFIGNAGVLTLWSNTDGATLKYVSEKLGQTNVRLAQPSGASAPQRLAGASGAREEMRVQRLAAPDELERIFARENGRLLVLAAGRKPVILKRATYYRDAGFNGCSIARHEPGQGVGAAVMATLKQEFEAKKSRKRLRIVAGAAVPVLLVVAFQFWLDWTLADALRSIDKSALKEPLRRQSFRSLGSISWHWVDASRRAEMIASMGRPSLIDTMFRVAGGRPFLFHPSSQQAFIDRSDGPVYVIPLGVDTLTGFAGFPHRGSILDIKPYKVAPNIVVIPLDRMSKFFRSEYRSGVTYWTTYLTRPGDDPTASRVPLSLADPLVAVAFGRSRP